MRRGWWKFTRFMRTLVLLPALLRMLLLVALWGEAYVCWKNTT